MRGSPCQMVRHDHHRSVCCCPSHCMCAEVPLRVCSSNLAICSAVASLCFAIERSAVAAGLLLLHLVVAVVYLGGGSCWLSAPNRRFIQVQCISFTLGTEVSICQMATCRLLLPMTKLLWCHCEQQEKLECNNIYSFECLASFFAAVNEKGRVSRQSRENTMRGALR